MPGDAKQEKTERFPVLEDNRKYAANHFLLVGKPGSGKSTQSMAISKHSYRNTIKEKGEVEG
ncbi:MAG: hypothetical protein C6Y22_00340 [Hapalosiphonaceae cyanobacterium JJU2]|nr:MAG: hypothetical protein C6Y22_00340 [Hapalosiphonaceae cyanobacterium JJU2]